MKRRQQIIMISFLMLLSSAVLAIAVPGSVLGQMTIPTRTPTPNPVDPTDPPPQPTDPGGGNNTPSATDPPPVQSSATPSTDPTDTPVPPGGTQVATNTAQPPAPGTGTATPTTSGAVGTTTATATLSATASATSISSEILPGTTPVAFPVVATAFPTAEPCGLPPTFTTSRIARVYSGPGNDYDLIETLAKDETRPIVGRAIYSTWWLIQLDGKFNQAWINDITGIAQGNTNQVPEIPAPEIDGVTPTPGVQWDPTPVVECELTPTATATDQVEVIVSGTINDDGEDSRQDIDSVAGPDSETDQRSLVAATAAPLDIPNAAPTPSLLPIAGLVLIIAAVFVALFLRRNPGGGEPSS